MKISGISILVLALTISFFSCNEDPEPAGKGRVVMTFRHLVNGEPVEYNNMKYTNAAGNPFEVTEVQWFISDVALKNDKGESITLDETEFAHYIDTNPQYATTLTWALPEEVPAGNYQSISITFGIKGEKNQHYIFPDQPESSMEWPITLGGENGGYHYMKLNGFWRNLQSERRPFNFHLGVGQEYDDDGAITGYIQNWFDVTLSDSGFALKDDETATVDLAMNIENWFKDPHIYDHNTYGGAIMNNQEAMGKGCENGRNGVFEVLSISVE